MISESVIEAESTSGLLMIGCATLSQASGSAKVNEPVQNSSPIQAQSSPALNVPIQAPRVIAEEVAQKYPFTALAKEKNIFVSKEVLFNQLYSK